VIAVLACTVLGVLSAAVLPTVPSYDPWSWIGWGRAMFDPHISFNLGGGPSWKPLPVVFTAIFSLFGGAAPTLWVITARIGGLLGLWGVWRLTHRLSGGGWLGHFAGALAAFAIVLTGRFDQAWYYYFLHGTSESMLIGLTVWAVDGVLEGRHLRAFVLGAAAGLLRPEFWPFLGIYAIWLWFRVPMFRNAWLRALLLAGLVAQPFGWFVPPWISLGHPFLAATHAHLYNGHLGSDVLRSIVVRAIRDQQAPALILAIIAVIIGWVRDRDRRLLALGAGAAAWWVVVIAETLDGYPGLERFFLPAATVICVLGGVGVAQLAKLAGALVRRLAPAGRGAGGPIAGVASGVVAVVIGLACIPPANAQLVIMRGDQRNATQGVWLLNELTRAVTAAGGHNGVLPCLSSFAAVNHSAQTALAWKLNVALDRIGTSMRAPGVDFIGPHSAQTGGPAVVDPRLTRSRLITVVGPWKVVALTDPRLAPTCVGR